MCGPATISTMFFIKNEFDKLLDEFVSTSDMEEDMAIVNQISNIIIRGDVLPKYVVGQIKKKSTSGNVQVALCALYVLDYCVNHCGDLLLDEIASEAAMQQLRNIVRSSSVHQDIKNKLLELLWSWAYRYRCKYKNIHNLVNTLRSEGCKFPELKESDPLFLHNTAPEWTTGTNCTLCESQFGVILRRHHCRACGNVFCSHCSSKTSSLPRFGIEKEVRVCDTCFNERSKFESDPISRPISIVKDADNVDGLFPEKFNNKKDGELGKAKEEFEEIRSDFVKQCSADIIDEREKDQDCTEANNDSIDHMHYCKICKDDYVCYCSDSGTWQNAPELKSHRICDKCSRKHSVPLLSSTKIKKKKKKDDFDSLSASSSDESESDIEVKEIRRELKMKKKKMSNADKENSQISANQSQDNQSSFNHQDSSTVQLINSIDSDKQLENNLNNFNEFNNFGKLVEEELTSLPHDKALAVQREILLILSKVKLNESFC